MEQLAAALHLFPFVATLFSEVNMDDPVTLSLTTQEIQKAHLIKTAVESDGSLKNLSDFEYAQWAVTHGSDSEGNDLATLLLLIGHMQAFRESYGIQDTVEEGVACMEALIAQQPGMILTHHYDPKTGNCVSYDDWRAFFPGRIKTRKALACYLKGSYYRYQCMYPTILASKVGVSSIVECEGVTDDNFDPGFHQRFLDELFVAYPHRFIEVYMVNSATVVNVACGLWKEHMSRNLKEKIRLGSRLTSLSGLEGVRLDSAFLTPTLEETNVETLITARNLLTTRYQNQNRYKLPPL